MIWFVYKDRLQKVAFHALQSMWYQIGWGWSYWPSAGPSRRSC